MHTRPIPELLAEHLAPVLPEGVRVETPGSHGCMFAVYGADGWWGDMGVDFDESWAGDELEARLQVYLDSIQDTVAHIVNGAWPNLENGELPPAWVRVSATTIEFGFGSVECAPIPLDPECSRVRPE
jgi:hypothetical protein